MTNTVRVLVALDIPATDDLDLNDLRDAVSARLEDEAGYAEDGSPYTPVRVAVDIVRDDTDLTEVGLRAIYEVGIEGADDGSGIESVADTLTEEELRGWREVGRRLPPVDRYAACKEHAGQALLEVGRGKPLTVQATVVGGDERYSCHCGKGAFFFFIRREETKSAIVIDAQPSTRRDADDCTCVLTCAEDPATACSLSGRWHTHPDPDGLGTFGPCPVHPDAPGDH